MYSFQVSPLTGCFGLQLAYEFYCRRRWEEIMPEGSHPELLRPKEVCMHDVTPIHSYHRHASPTLHICPRCSGATASSQPSYAGPSCVKDQASHDAHTGCILG